MTDPIGNDTFYTVLARAPGEIRPYQFEGPTIESVEEVLAAISQFPKGYSLWCVFQHDYDVPRRDVTEDIVRAAYQSLRDAGHSVLSDDLPQWISEHLPSDLDGGYRVAHAAE